MATPQVTRKLAMQGWVPDGSIQRPVMSAVVAEPVMTSRAHHAALSAMVAGSRSWTDAMMQLGQNQGAKTVCHPPCGALCR